MTARAVGTFEVTLTPQEQTVPVARLNIAKTLRGGLEGRSSGEMLSYAPRSRARWATWRSRGTAAALCSSTSG